MLFHSAGRLMMMMCDGSTLCWREGMPVARSHVSECLWLPSTASLFAVSLLALCNLSPLPPLPLSPSHSLLCPLQLECSANAIPFSLTFRCTLRDSSTSSRREQLVMQCRCSALKCGQTCPPMRAVLFVTHWQSIEVQYTVGS